MNCWFCHFGTKRSTQLWNSAPCVPGSTIVAPSSRMRSIALSTRSIDSSSAIVNSDLSMYSRMTPMR